jgi:hypothetical protein
VSHAEALNSGFHLAYLIGAILVAVAIVVALSVLRTPKPAPEHGERTQLKPAADTA